MNGMLSKPLQSAILFALVGNIALLMQLIEYLGVEPSETGRLAALALTFSLASFVYWWIGEDISRMIRAARSPEVDGE